MSKFYTLLPYEQQVEENIIVSKNGYLSAFFKVEGIDITMMPFERLVTLYESIGKAFGSLGLKEEPLHIDNISTHKPLIKQIKPKNFFKNEVAQKIDNIRTGALSDNKSFFENNNYLIFSKKIKKGLKIENAITNLNKEINSLFANIPNDISIEKLNCNNYNETISLIRYIITGDDIKITKTINPLGVNEYFDVPVDNFSDKIKKVGDNYIGTITIKTLSDVETMPGLLAGLLSVKCKFTINSNFASLGYFEAKKKLGAKHRYYTQKQTPLMDQATGKSGRRINEQAVADKQEIEHIQSEINRGAQAIGKFSSVLVIYGKSIEEVENGQEEITQIFLQNNITYQIESYNCFQAYLSSLPNNIGYREIRQSLVVTQNFVDGLMINNSDIGSPVNPSKDKIPNSPSLMIVKNESNEPYHFNIHVDDVGHTLILGSTGAGKSTLLALLYAQFQRYSNAQIIAFDKGMSLYPITLASKGIHYDLGKDDLSLAPLAHLNAETDNFTIEQDFIMLLLSLSNYTLSSDEPKKITEALQTFSKSKSAKSLSNFVATLGSIEMKKALSDYTREGALGTLLDADVSDISISSLLTFEIETLMNMSEKAVLPVLSYLFGSIEKKLKGEPTIIILDEAWLMLSNDFFKEKIREWLKTLRKKNCAVIMATQSIADAVESGILSVLLESCFTKIYLPNPEVKHNQQSADQYEKNLGLSPFEIDIIGESTPKRDYYINQPNSSRLINLNLSPYELAFVGKSADKDIAKIKDLYNNNKENWVQEWLKFLNI